VYVALVISDFAGQRSQAAGETPSDALGVSDASAEKACGEVPQTTEGK